MNTILSGNYNLLHLDIYNETIQVYCFKPKENVQMANSANEHTRTHALMNTRPGTLTFMVKIIP